MTTGMTALEHYNSIVNERQSRATANDRLREMPPVIGNFSPPKQAAIQRRETGLGFVQARRVFVDMPLWGRDPTPTLDLGVYHGRIQCPNGRVRLTWTCFHWPTGTTVAEGKTRREAISNALVNIEMHGRERFEAAVEIQIEKNGGKRLN